MDSTLDAALQYASRGWSVIPVNPGGKAPIGKLAPDGCHSATNDQQTIKDWWHAVPSANIGIATGPIFVVDLDVKNGVDGMASWDELVAGREVPETLTVETPSGGRHIYLRAPDGIEIRNSAGRLADGVDVRGQGGYVLAPPSFTETGAYKFVKKVPVADAPGWLIEELVPSNDHYERAAPVDGDVPKGQRNDTLASLAGTMRRRGMREPEIFAALREVNKARCAPPLPEEEVRSIAESVARYEPADDDAGDNNDASSTERKSAATHVIELVFAEAELFHSERAMTFARRHADGTNLLLDSDAFRHWVSSRYLEWHKRALPSSAFTDALHALKGLALREQHNVSVRTCGDLSERVVYVNLGRGRIAQVTPDEICVVSATECPVRFWEPSPAKPLPEPDLDGTLDDVAAALSLDGSALLVAAGWLLAALLPGGPFPVLAVLGPQGSGKSTRCRHLTRVIDPSSLLLRTTPRSEDDLIVAARSTHVLAFDNISKISDWFSDGLCRIATGGGLAKRTLYTNVDVTVVTVKRPIILNAIVDVVERSDLADRIMLLNLDRLNERHTERQVEARFGRLHAKALGAVLKGVQCALRNFESVKVPHLPRMADACLWAEAGLRGLSTKPLAFYRAYRSAHEEANRAIIESDLLGSLIATVAERGGFEGTATKLLDRLRILAEGQDRRLPPDAPRLAKRLRELDPALREGMGVEIEFVRTADARIIKITSVPSSPSLPSQPGAGRDTNDGDDGNDSSRRETLTADNLQTGDRVCVRKTGEERVVRYINDGRVVCKVPGNPWDTCTFSTGDLEPI